MDVLTRSSNGRARARNLRAPASALIGLAAVASLPAAVALTRYSNRASLLDAAIGIAPALIFGLSALMLARGARLRVERTLGRARGLALARAGRVLGILGMYVAATAGLALCVFAVLSRLSS